MAIDPVVIRFAASGVQDVGKAIATVNDQLGRFEQRHTTSARRGKDDRVRAAKDEAREKLKAEQSVAKQVEKSEREKVRAHNASLGQLKRIVAQMTREEKSAESAKLKEVERAERYKTQLRRNSAEMAGRYAARAAAEEMRATERSARTRSRVLSGAFRGGGTLGRLAGGAMTLAGAGLGIGGGLFVADAARQQMEAQRTAALLINTVTTGKAPPKGANLAGILGQAGQVSSATGLDKNTVLQGALEYSRKARGGDFAGSMANMGFFAKMSQVTGADITDIAGAAGTLQSQNQNLKAPEMQQMLLDVYAQGKAGSMSMVDVAKQIGVLGAPATSFAGDQATNQRKLLALGQLAAPQGSVEEAGTFVKDLVSEAGGHRKQLEKMGVKYGKGGLMESPEQMIDAVLSGTGGDITKIEKLFGKRGTQTFRPLQKAYLDAGGGAKGVSAANAIMSSVSTATMTTDQLEQQHQQIMDTPAQKFTAALEKVRESIEARMEPAMEKFADKLSDPNVQKGIDSFIDGVASVAKFMADNPFTGIGAIVLASVAKDIAGAAIGEAVKGVLLRLLGGGGGGAPVPGAGGGGGGAAGAGIVGAGVAATAAGVSVIDVFSAKSRGKEAGAFAVDALVGNIRRGADPEGKQAKAAIAQAQVLAKMSGTDVGNALLNPVAMIGQATGLLSKGEGALGGKDAGGRMAEIAQARVLIANIDKINAALAEGAKKLMATNSASRGVVSNAPVTSIGQRSAM